MEEGSDGIRDTKILTPAHVAEKLAQNIPRDNLLVGAKTPVLELDSPSTEPTSNPLPASHLSCLAPEVQSWSTKKSVGHQPLKPELSSMPTSAFSDSSRNLSSAQKLGEWLDFCELSEFEMEARML